MGLIGGFVRWTMRDKKVDNIVSKNHVLYMTHFCIPTIPPSSPHKIDMKIADIYDCLLPILMYKLSSACAFVSHGYRTGKGGLVFNMVKAKL